MENNEKVLDYEKFNSPSYNWFVAFVFLQKFAEILPKNKELFEHILSIESIINKHLYEDNK